MAGMMTSIAMSASVAGVVMLAMAALHDIMARTVSNRLALGVAGAGLVSQAAQAVGGTGHPAFSLAVALAVFVLAALLWRRGLMGGADVKLLGATALLFEPLLVPSLLAAISLSGAGLAIVYLLARRRLKRAPPGRPPGLLARVVRAERWRLRRGGPLPYAVAIASGACFVLTHGGLS